MIIGVISDTHNLLRPQVFEVFEGVHAIIHAGDIGSADILTELKALAPVYAVYGNCDRFPLTETLKDRERFFLGDIQIFVTHIGGKPHEMSRFYPDMKGCEMVVFGHSHKPLHVVKDGIVFLNPGAAGPRRFSLPITVAKVEIVERRIKAEIIPLV